MKCTDYALKEGKEKFSHLRCLLEKQTYRMVITECLAFEIFVQCVIFTPLVSHLEYRSFCRNDFELQRDRAYNDYP